MNKYATYTPEGTGDLLFEECDARRKVERELSVIFKARGYKKVITPTLEFFDVFNRESSGLEPESMFTLTDYRGRIMVLRPDSTLPIARIAATRLKGSSYPLRLYYNQRVFRRSPKFSGLSDEITQSGIELIGASGLRADLEIIVSATDVLERCGGADFSIEIGHAGFFKAISKSLKASFAVKSKIVELVETKNYAALNDLLDTLEDSEASRVLRNLPRLFGGKDVIDEALESCKTEEEIVPLKYLATLYEKLAALGYKDRINIDLGLVHRNNYYTGVVFRGFIQGSGQTVLSGGRYDSLIGEFGKKLASTGFGVEIDALAQAMLKRGEAPEKLKVDVLVFGEEGFEVEALAHMRNLNTQGLICENCVEINLEDAKAYARRAKIGRLDFVTATGAETFQI